MDSQSLDVCSLTHCQGKFVKAHVIPESLTRPATKGRPLYQVRGGTNEPAVRRWTSWYDPRLVTEAGEKILSDLDGWAVHELRSHRLVWSGWGNETALSAEHAHLIPGSIGIRKVEGIDPIKLRLFFLSLLWRAAASTRDECSEINLSSESLEQLRLMVLNGKTQPLSFYPCQLTQISTKGLIHNHAPSADMKFLPDLNFGGRQSLPLPSYRFYFDGLIAHMAVSLPKGQSAEILGPLIVGVENTIVLSTVTFEDSLQYKIIRGIFSGRGEAVPNFPPATPLAPPGG